MLEHDPGTKKEFTGFERAMALAGAGTLKEALPICLESLLEASGGHLDCGWVYLIPEETDIFTLRHSAGVGSAFADANCSWDFDSVHGKTLLRELPWYGRFSDCFSERDATLSGEGLSAFAILPVFRERQVCGCFCLASHTAESISQHVRHDLEAFVGWFDKTINRVQVSESRIRESWNLLALFDAMAEMVFAFGLDGEVLWMNRTTHEELGFGRNENDRIHLLDLYPAEWHPEAAKIFRKMLSREQQTSSLPFIRRDGSIFHATTRGVPGRWRGDEVLFGISRIHEAVQGVTRDLVNGIAGLEKEIVGMAALFNDRLARLEEAVLPPGRGTEEFAASLRDAGGNI
ncbi:MAG: PAS domain-containing protein [Thermovirgaceae bacterium]|nr:PAS domain-containing protein [Thermovirgaceae bacterium]